LKDATGRPTVWCQQHDALTLKPCAARNFEPVASCTNESASLTRFLMSIPNPSPEIVAAVKGAVAWFERTAQRDIAVTRNGGVVRLIERAGAPPLWARMYELGTDKPIFGDRDRTVHFAFDELSSERKNGYAWYGAWPASVLEAYKSWPGKDAAETPKLRSAVYDWQKMEATPTENGVRRMLFDGPTTTLDKLHSHITTLNPGQASGEPRRHLQEEVIIVKEGRVEATVDGKSQTVGPGSVIFFAANAVTRLRNAGDTPATYIVVYYYTPLTPKN
jgi:mannose-6-phosphate isomerase-like protein (cupin superfamily)